MNDIIQGHSAKPGFASPATKPRRRTLGCLWPLVAAAVLVVVLAIALVLAIPALRLAGYETVRLSGIAMDPTIKDRTLLMVNRRAYWMQSPQRGDTVLFRYPRRPELIFTSRVVGLPGECLEVREGVVHVDGKALQENYVPGPAGYKGEWTVGPTEVFVLGDNRNNASDSHTWGPLPVTAIVGRVDFIYWPPSAVRSVVRPTYR